VILSLEGYMTDRFMCFMKFFNAKLLCFCPKSTSYTTWNSLCILKSQAYAVTQCSLLAITMSFLKKGTMLLHTRVYFVRISTVNDGLSNYLLIVGTRSSIGLTSKILPEIYLTNLRTLCIV